jgi:hypothetical protein
MSKSKGLTEIALTGLFHVLLGELHAKQPSCPKKQQAIDRQVLRARKRAATSNRELHTKAISDFVCTNALVGDVTVLLPNEVVIEARYFINRCLENFTTKCDPRNIQTTLDTSFLFDNWRFGPGASNGISGTHTADKISQSMTCTALCEPLVVRLRRHNTYFQLFDERNRNSGVVSASGSRLTTVPKNETTNRTIAIEPSGNMALQLAAGMYLEGTLRNIGLDIRDQQPKNKALAMVGSIDGCIATIDLKSASDMFSIDLVRLLMPPEWFSLLMTIRSPEIEIPKEGKQGKYNLDLNMMSTMGNGFTFPLMTMILVALVYANRRLRGGPSLFIDWSRTAVFGDDIIVPTHEYESLVSLLEAAGLIVNREKSYSDGPFRESCGGDYYEGYNITPFYIKSLHNDSEIYVAINQVLEWSARHNIALPGTLLYLKAALKGRVRFVPEWHGPDEGLLVADLVEREYTYLQATAKRFYLHDQNGHASLHFKLPLACGMYITSDGPDIVFTPRPKDKTRHVVRHGRLPKGFLTGWDPLKRSPAISSYISVLCGVLFPQ